MSKANPYDRLVGFIRFHNIHINEEMKLRDIVKEVVAFEKSQPPSQLPQTPIDREPEGIENLWNDFAIEYERLQRMEENDWEWNRKILMDQYHITRK